MELKNCLNENKKIPADLKIKLAVYVVNCLFLALVNYVTSPHYWWVCGCTWLGTECSFELDNLVF